MTTSKRALRQGSGRARYPWILHSTLAHKKPHPPDPTVGLHLGSYGGPREGGELGGTGRIDDAEENRVAV